MVRVLGENKVMPGMGEAAGCCTGCMQSCPLNKATSRMFYFLGDAATCPTQMIPTFF